MEFSVDSQVRSHTAAAFRVGSDPAGGIVNYFCNIRKMKFASLSLSRVRVSVSVRVMVMVRDRVRVSASSSSTTYV